MAHHNGKPYRRWQISDWLLPGLGVKRWVALLLLGVTVLGLALSFVLVDIYQGGYLPPAMDPLTMQFVPRYVLTSGIGVLGAAVIVYSLLRLLRQEVVVPLLPSGRSVTRVVAQHRRRSREKNLVVLGGGTGMASLLRGIKAHTSNVTAIVTVADDGGSSGRLRSSLGVLPPGDFRNCLAALADDEALITQLFQYRFGGTGEISGHSFGNLFISAMSEVTGSFERGLLESSEVLAIQGHVLPSTLQDVTLCADIRAPADKVTQRIAGESAILEAVGRIERVYLDPDDSAAYPGAVQAILAADMIVTGPGSLFTSILPNFLVRDVTAAIRTSRALKVYVCNVATQPGETDGFSVDDHVRALDAHTEGNIFPLVIANIRQHGTLLPDMDWTKLGSASNGSRDIISADVVDEAFPWRHDSMKLAAVLCELLESNRREIEF